MQKKKFIKVNSLDKLIEKGRIPLLFVGSGISRRYMNDYPTWDELLVDLAQIVGITQSQFIAAKQDILYKSPDYSPCEVNASLASWISQFFTKQILNGNKDLLDYFTEEEIKIISDNDVPFIKMLIVKRLSEYTLYDSKGATNEIAEFKKLEANIGAVVTTNYDLFLEKEIFKNFDLFVSQNQYYMMPSEGIGELYKIHGSISNPNSIVLTAEDYENFNKNLRVVSSKLLSLALEYPIIFLGYSLEDENVLNILCSIIECLDEKQLLEFSSNIIYVEWQKKQNSIVESRKEITHNGKTMKFTCLTTDNFYVLYKILQRFVPSERPERVRKYKKMIRELIIQSNKGNPTIIGVENIDKLNHEGNLAIAFGDINDFAEKGITGVGVEDLIKYVLIKRELTEINANAIYEQVYLSSRVSQTQYVPIFYVLKFVNGKKSDNKLKEMKKRVLKKVDEINNDTAIIPFEKSDEIIIEDFSSTSKHKYLSRLVKSFSADYIEYEEYIEILKRLAEYDPLLYKCTDFRVAVTYADIK